MEIKPSDLDPLRRYKVLTGCVVPRPVAFVSTLSPDGRTNLAPFSFFNGVGTNPMTIIFCPTTGKDGEDNDTLRNAKPEEEGGTGEFVVNAASAPYIREVSAAAEDLPYGESEFDLTGLETEPSVVVAPPRVADSPYCFECRTLQLIRTNPGVPGSGNLVIGEIVHIRLKDDLINSRWHVNPRQLQAMGRMGGENYCTTSAIIEVPRGRTALGKNPSA